MNAYVKAMEFCVSSRLTHSAGDNCLQMLPLSAASTGHSLADPASGMPSMLRPSAMRASRAPASAGDERVTITRRCRRVGGSSL